MPIFRVFKNYCLEAQEQVVTPGCKSRKEGRRSAWLNGEHLLELKRKRKSYDLWKQGQALLEYYRDMICVS